MDEHERPVHLCVSRAHNSVWQATGAQEMFVKDPVR